MGFKFPFKNSKIGVTPLASESQVKVPIKREVKLAEANEDWSEKTASNWSEHSGFVEMSKGADLAPPPRLDPRTVPRPAPPVHGLSPAEKNLAIGLVLALGMVFGAYENGLFSRKKQAPVVVADDAPSEESNVAAQPREVTVPPIANKNQPVIVPPEAPKVRLPAQATPSSQVPPVKH